MKFLKLKMVWAIIRGRTVVYRAEFVAGMGLRVKSDKSCIIENNFVNIRVRNKNGDVILNGKNKI